MTTPIRQSGFNAPGDVEDDVVSTPEGDNEYPPSVPVGPAEGLQVANGNGPTVYDADKPSHPDRRPRDSDDPTDPPPKDETRETVDKLSLGQILT